MTLIRQFFSSRRPFFSQLNSVCSSGLFPLSFQHLKRSSDYNNTWKRCYTAQPDNLSPAPMAKEVVVYVGPLRRKIKIVKMISLSSSAVGCLVQPYVVFSMSQVSSVAAAAVSAVSLGFLATPLILDYITRRYVVELRFNTGTKVFTAKTLNLLSRIRELRFKAEDVSVPTIPGMLNSILVNKVPLFVDANLVLCPDSFGHMMGYDKPIDFSVPNKETVKT